MKMFYNCEYIEKHWIAQWWIACYKDSIKRKSSEQRIIQHHLSIKYTFVVVHSPSRVRLFATPWTAARQAPLSFTISWSLLKLMSIESVMPSNHLILCHPLLLLPSIFPSIRVFPNELALPIKWPKYWSFSFSISPFNEYSGLVSFRIDWFDLCCPRDSQKPSPAPKVESINSLALRFLHGPPLTSI